MSIVAAGLLQLALELLVWEPVSFIRLVLYITVFVVASCLKVWLPGITGTMSVNYVFVLLAIQEMPLPGILVMTSIGAAAQNGLACRITAHPHAGAVQCG